MRQYLWFKSAFVILSNSMPSSPPEKTMNELFWCKGKFILLICEFLTCVFVFLGNYMCFFLFYLDNKIPWDIFISYKYLEFIFWKFKKESKDKIIQFENNTKFKLYYQDIFFYWNPLLYSDKIIYINRFSETLNSQIY